MPPIASGIEPELGDRELRRDQHHGDRGDGVRLEQVGRHARAVADVVADVVRDHGRVARVVLGDARLDLPHEVGADVGRLREDAAAESCEDGDQRTTEREADQIVDRRVGRVVQEIGEHPVVTGDTEQSEPDDEESGDGSGLEGDVECGLHAPLRRLGCADVRAHGDVHADEAGRRGQHRADQEADRRPPAELVVEAEDQERHDGDDGDRRVLLLQVRGRAFLDGARDLLHPLRARGLAHEPDREVEAVADRHACADEREQHGMVVEEACYEHLPSLTKFGSQSQRRIGPAREIFYHKVRSLTDGAAGVAGLSLGACSERPLALATAEEVVICHAPDSASNARDR